MFIGSMLKQVEKTKNTFKENNESLDLLVSDIKCLKNIQFCFMHRVANKLNIYKLKYMLYMKYMLGGG